VTTTAVPAARTALETAGLPEATTSPSGQIATAGYLVTPLRALGPDRAAVHWLTPAPPAGRPAPGAGLARCQDALHAAGCLCELVITSSGGYLAVLPPKPSPEDPRPQHAVSVSISDLALVLRHVHATRLGGPHARPASQAPEDAIFAYRRLKDAITRHPSTGSPS